MSCKNNNRYDTSRCSHTYYFCYAQIALIHTELHNLNCRRQLNIYSQYVREYSTAQNICTPRSRVGCIYISISIYLTTIQRTLVKNRLSKDGPALGPRRSTCLEIRLTRMFILISCVVIHLITCEFVGYLLGKRSRPPPL
jgi:hypothetical protein